MQATAALANDGTPIPPDVRREFESKLGRDLRAVRLHDTPSANRAAERMGARAFTVGDDIGFARGQFDLQRTSGRRLLAHELGHTIQQSNGTPRVQRETWDIDADSCSATVLYKVKYNFIDRGSDRWTEERKTKFRRELDSAVETTFSSHNFVIKPLLRETGAIWKDPCPCYKTGFKPSVVLLPLPEGSRDWSADWIVNVTANSTGADLGRPSNNDDEAKLGETDNNPEPVRSSGPGVKQIASVHEFGHFIGLSHPGAGLAGVVSNAAAEYSHKGLDQHFHLVDGSNDLLGGGMGLRKFYFENWRQKISNKFGAGCQYLVE